MLGIIIGRHIAVCDPNHNPATPSRNGTSCRDARLRPVYALWTLEKLSRIEQFPVPAMPHPDVANDYLDGPAQESREGMGF
jgi:hypothetical protein